MDARTYLRNNWPTSDSVLRIFEDDIVRLMEDFARLKESIVSKPTGNYVIDQTCTDHDPVIKHFRDDEPHMIDDNYSGIMSQHFNRED